MTRLPAVINAKAKDS